MLIIHSSVLWNPSGNGSQVISVSEQHLNLWDINTSTAILEVSDTKQLHQGTVQTFYLIIVLHLSSSLLILPTLLVKVNPSSLLEDGIHIMVDHS